MLSCDSISSVICPAQINKCYYIRTSGGGSGLADLPASYSFYAYTDATGNVDPDEAYRFAKGEMVNYMGTPVVAPARLRAVVSYSKVEQSDERAARLQAAGIGTIDAPVLDTADSRTQLTVETPELAICLCPAEI
jgi:hypothetical protein